MRKQRKEPLGKQEAAVFYLLVSCLVLIQPVRLARSAEEAEHSGGSSQEAGNVPAWDLPDSDVSPEALTEIKDVLGSAEGKELLESAPDLEVLTRLDPKSEDHLKLLSALGLPSIKDRTLFIERFKSSSRLELAELVNERSEQLLAFAADPKNQFKEKDYFAAAAALKAFKDWPATSEGVASVNGIAHVLARGASMGEARQIAVFLGGRKTADAVGLAGVAKKRSVPALAPPSQAAAKPIFLGEALEGPAGAKNRPADAVARRTMEILANSFLADLAAGGNLAEIETLVQNGADIDAKDKSGRSALVRAAENGQAEVVRFLLSKGAAGRIKAFFRAFGRGNISVAAAIGRDMVSSPASLGLALGEYLPLRQARRQSDLDSSLIAAAREGSLPLIAKDLDLGADIEAKEKDRGEWEIDRGERTPLMTAIWHGRLDAARLLLARGADPNARDYEERTPLMIAAMSGRLDAVKLLLSYGARIDAKDEYGNTAYDYAKAEIERDIMEYLRRIQLRIVKIAELYGRGEYGRTALMDAVSRERFREAQVLLGMGASVNAKDIGGVTALMLARDSRMMKLLLFYEAEPDIRDVLGNTALMRFATLGGRVDQAGLLLDAKADVNAANKKGETALHLACHWGHPEMAALLLDRGARLEAEDKSGLTPLMTAAKYGRLDIIRLLLDRGVKRRFDAISLAVKNLNFKAAWLIASDRYRRIL